MDNGEFRATAHKRESGRGRAGFVPHLVVGVQVELDLEVFA